jgi:ubiquinone/menaquinone biosynthesis C-methylase UbiE
MKRCLRCERCFDTDGWSCPDCGFAPPTILGFPAFAADLAATDIGYDASWFHVLAGLEHDHFWFRARTKLIVWALHRHFPHTRSLLEIGCGTGNVLAAIADDLGAPRLVGADAHSSGLAFAARRAGQTEWLQMDARRIPYREEFDVVGAFDVIEHVVEDEQVLAEMFAACRPGGGIIVTVPQHQWLWSGRDANHQRRYSRRELLRKIAAAGFRQAWSTSFVTFLLPVLYLSRRQRTAPERSDASHELQIGRAINRLLGAVMTLERQVIAGGLSLSAGGSLLAIAHKPGSPT